MKKTAFLLGIVFNIQAIAQDVDIHHIPLGDGKVSQEPKSGYVYSCGLPKHGGGANHIGEWVGEDSWDLSKKIFVRGNKTIGTGAYSVKLNLNDRNITTNDIPQHPVGNFPINRDDPAWEIDKNPNNITEQDININIPLNPSINNPPSCVPMGPIAIMNNGVVLYNALDDMGRDAVAHEVQDNCNGHPQRQGQYHYHGASPCLPETAEKNRLLGYALDGFGIYSNIDESGKTLTNKDLDECHGVVSPIFWDGKMVNMYHYVLTTEYPYSVGCFRGAPLKIKVHNEADNSNHNNNGRRFGNRPPTEAIAACENKQNHNACKINTPRGDVINGMCTDFGDFIACTPSNH